MVKRLLSSNTSDILSMTSKELKQSIKASEGRVILSENVVIAEPFISDITNSEIAKAFGADLILLNALDVFNPEIKGLEHDKDNFVDKLHKLTGRPIGVNLEPVDKDAQMLEDKTAISDGRQASVDTFKKIESLNMDFVCLTGNPGTGVTNNLIEESVRCARENFSGLIIAGKMHGAGVDEPVLDVNVTKKLIDNGADIILVPSIGAIAGVSPEDVKRVVNYAHKRDVLVMSAIGTSQEGSSPETIRYMAIQNKMCGVDIQHIGDAGYGGMAPVENIFEMSKAIRGIRHTVSMVSRSVNR
ncbi:PEP phosphonomutase [Dolosigranulum pigrum]|uniref:DUF7916 family protein n=1 Tax=Dolosigranulum pigrum TaxID=29394 RepID=UPI000DBFE24E|nr:haloacid dehalogenase-like hydrolase [Dolosigranulum pigrum]RAN55529.1 PEP phosphonomutase [Dolosigranulum pigrum]RAN56797.1 PEP phosphonomutase [Dolosigranulum pigrum]VTU55271.1 PEP phosphonomutase [Lactobacillus murinus] [Dolosigranulum pigrum]